MCVGALVITNYQLYFISALTNTVQINKRLITLETPVSPPSPLPSPLLSLTECENNCLSAVIPQDINLPKHSRASTLKYPLGGTHPLFADKCKSCFHPALQIVNSQAVPLSSIERIENSTIEGKDIGYLELSCKDIRTLRFCFFGLVTRQNFSHFTEVDSCLRFYTEVDYGKSLADAFCFKYKHTAPRMTEEILRLYGLAPDASSSSALSMSLSSSTHSPRGLVPSPSSMKVTPAKKGRVSPCVCPLSSKHF